MPAEIHDAEMQKIFSQIQKNASEMFTLLVQSQAEVARLKVQVISLEAQLAIMQRGAA